MSKNVLILNGSPREQGNCSTLSKAFTAGAESSGHTVKEFHLQNMNIDSCNACNKPDNDLDSPCSIKDDMDQVYAAFNKCDVVVLATPTYFWTLSGQLKCTIDRLFAVMEVSPDRKIPQKDCILMVSAGGTIRDEDIHWYDTLVQNLQWNSIGKVLAHNCLKAGAVKDKAEFTQAEKMGKDL